MDLVLSLSLHSARFTSGAARIGWPFEFAFEIYLIFVIRFGFFEGNLSELG